MHTPPLILASGSQIRAELLRRNKVHFDVVRARLDEAEIKHSLVSEGVKPRDVADALAEAKARKVASSHPEAIVLGCDQVLDLDGEILSKPATQEEALAQLKSMRGRQHSLFSAAVIYEDIKPVWRHVGQVRLLMRDASDAWLEEYVERNWDSIRHSVGAYKLEEEGPRLFSRIEGDYFHILGLPLLELLSYLTLRGTLPR